MEQEKSKIQSWLDNLQQESWQLELIISSILLLIIGSYDEKIPELILKYNSLEGFNFAFIIAALKPILVFIKSNLIAHIFLRGLWIGCIGLRYISSDINYDAFGYVGRFDKFLKKKILPFDTYVEKLERVCSIIFSYSFLMVFHFISFALFFTIIQILNYYGYRLLNDTFLGPVLDIISFILILSGILNLIDFISIGKLKKTKYISTVFYPFYRIYNFFSLSFLYRPIHYNFISNQLGRKYMLLMLPYMLFLALAGNEISYQEFTYIPQKENGANWVIERNYDDLRKGSTIKQFSIDKLFYDQNEPIKLFLRMDDKDSNNKLIKHLCPDISSYDRYNFIIKPFDAATITMSDRGKYIKRTTVKERESKIEQSISCIAKIFEISIDTMPAQSLDYVFYENPNAKEPGLLTGININALKPGKHNLNIKIKRLKNGKIEFGDTIVIPFFKN